MGAATFPMGSSSPYSSGNLSTSLSNSPAGQPTPRSQTDQSKPQPSISDWVTEKWREVKEAYTSFHMMAWEAILMQAGETWVKWDATRKVFTPDAPADDWTPTPRVNRFAPTIDAVVSNFGNVPEVEATVRGDKGDPLQWGIADVASRLADDWVESQGIRQGSNRDDDMTGEAGMAFVLCGSIFTKVEQKIVGSCTVPMKTPQQVVQGKCPQCATFYDDLQPIPMTQSYLCQQCNIQIPNVQPGEKLKPLTNPDGTPVEAPIDTIDADLVVGLPIYAHPRVGSRSMRDCPYLFWAERRSIDYIKLRLQVDDAEPDDEQVDGFSVGYEHALSYFYQGVNQTTKANKDSALVIECYVPPKMVADFPDGFKATMVNGDCKKEEAWPGIGSDHPLTYAVYQKVLTLFFGRSVAFELTGIQKEYQTYESLIKLHAMTSAVSPIVIDANTQVSAITGRADKIIKWRSIGPGSKEPHRMMHGALDNGVYAQRQSLRDEFENVSGAVAVYKGQQPGSVTAASAIGKLQTQAEAVFTKPQQNWNSLWKESVRKAVVIRQQAWTIAQIAAVVGDDKLVHIRAFKNCNMEKTLDWVATAHGLPRSRQQKMDEMLMLWDRGALDISDPNIREKIFELFGDVGVMQNFNLDATRARVENLDMKNGRPVVVMAGIEDLAVHLAVHLQCAKELSFDEWLPQAKFLMLKHIMETRQAIQMEMMAQAAAGQGPAQGPGQGGGPGGPPKPPGPGGGGAAGPGHMPPAPIPGNGPQAGPPQGNHPGAPPAPMSSPSSRPGHGPRNSGGVVHPVHRVEVKPRA